VVTNPDAIDAPPTREERIEEAARTLIAGHPQGAVRRIVLYVIAFVLVVSPLPVLAVAPLALLALTDSLA
jgi:hypothetical protein